MSDHIRGIQHALARTGGGLFLLRLSMELTELLRLSMELTELRHAVTREDLDQEMWSRLDHTMLMLKTAEHSLASVAILVPRQDYMAVCRGMMKQLEAIKDDYGEHVAKRSTARLKGTWHEG